MSDAGIQQGRRLKTRPDYREFIYNYYCKYRRGDYLKASVPHLKSPQSLLPRRERLIPWRGPIHFMLLLVTSVLTLLVPVVYLLALFAGALYLGIELYFCNQI
jgi:hypothetical protein